MLTIISCRQGLTFADGTLWESNGLYGKSTVRILDPDTADVIKSVDMDADLFGEGMAHLLATEWGVEQLTIRVPEERGFREMAVALAPSSSEHHHDDERHHGRHRQADEAEVVDAEII